jgi:tRNA pseudouridine38-40 synthase
MRSFVGRFAPVLLISLIFQCQWCLSFRSPRLLRRRTTATCVTAQVEAETSQSFTCVLRVSYDGSRFTGWSAANDSAANGEGKGLELPKPSKRFRKRNKIEGAAIPKGFVRSVEGVLRANLAKIYGNVDPRRIVVEACSRTDRGVHAQWMIAQIYCLKAGVLEQLDDAKEETNDSATNNPIHRSIPGKRLPHPQSPEDHSYFEPLPMNGNLSRLAFALNRMRPADVQVTGISPVPRVPATSRLPFHPTLSSQSKRYEYKLSTGSFQDPMISRVAWHVDDTLDLAKIEQGCRILVGSHNFAAFQGVPRGPENRKKYRMNQDHPDASKCNLILLDIETLPAPSELYFKGVSPPMQCYKVTVEGDRFLYKMVRFLVGALVAVGMGKLDCEDLECAVQVGNWDIPGQAPRRKEFECAPAHGLVLANVDFGPLELDWQPLVY